MALAPEHPRPVLRSIIHFTSCLNTHFCFCQCRSIEIDLVVSSSQQNTHGFVVYPPQAGSVTAKPYVCAGFVAQPEELIYVQTSSLRVCRERNHSVERQR